jgi:hypothetical protein
MIRAEFAVAAFVLTGEDADPRRARAYWFPVHGGHFRDHPLAL